MRHAFVCLFTLAGSVAVGGAAASTPAATHTHAEVVLPRNPQLSLQQVVAAAAAVAPGQATLQARATQARAYAARSRSWQSAPGAITVDHLQNRSGGVTSTETMLGYQWSLWRWGERSAQADYSRSRGRQAEQERAAWDWQREQQIHDAFARLRWAADDESAAESKLEVLQGVAVQVRQRVTAGDLAARESDRARVLLLGAESELTDARARHVEAARHWLQLTANTEQPADWDAELVRPVTVELSPDLYESHPALRTARAAAHAAAAQLQVAKAHGQGAPVLFLGVREDRVTGQADSGAGYASLTLPLGGASHARAAQADLALAAAQAEDALRDARRRAEWEVHEAFHELAVQRQQWQQAEERDQLAAVNLKKSLNAFALGEISLLEVSLDQQTRLDAGRAASRATHLLQRARARVNSLLGES